MGQILQGVFIMGPNGGTAIHIEAAVAPGEHVFDDSIRNLAFGLEHFKDLIAEEFLQISWFWTQTNLEYAITGKTAISGNNVQMRIKVLKIAKCLDGDSGAGSGTLIRDGPFQVGAQYLPATARELGKQLSVVHKIDSQPLGDAKHPLPVRNRFEYFGAQPFAEFNHPFLVAGGAEMPPLA